MNLIKFCCEVWKSSGVRVKMDYKGVVGIRIQVFSYKNGE